MPRWTFTSGPNRGRTYVTSAEAPLDDAAAANDTNDGHDLSVQIAGDASPSIGRKAAERARRWIRSGASWGRIAGLRVRRNTRVVDGHPRRVLADFEVTIDIVGNDEEGKTANQPTVARFGNVSVADKRTDPTGEIGAEIAILSDVREGDAIELTTVSTHAMLWRHMDDYKRKLRKEDAARAIAPYSPAAARNPSAPPSAATYRARGNAHFRRNEHTLAIEAYEHGALLASRAGDAQCAAVCEANAAEAHLRLGAYARAEAASSLSCSTVRQASRRWEEMGKDGGEDDGELAMPQKPLGTLETKVLLQRRGADPGAADARRAEGKASVDGAIAIFWNAPANEC